jgi:CRISPR/Cas system-associated exonuclease Cas4 (RecB family)
MSTGTPKSDESRVIRASEIGEFIYCHRAWWLGRVKGVENANRAQMDAGVVRHRAHGQTVRRAELLQRAALVLALLAVGMGAALLALVLGVIR